MFLAADRPATAMDQRKRCRAVSLYHQRYGATGSLWEMVAAKQEVIPLTCDAKSTSQVNRSGDFAVLAARSKVAANPELHQEAATG